MKRPRGLRALDHAEFRRFFAAQFLAQVGSWMQTVAQSWLVLQLTNSAFLLGLMGTLQFGPVLLFSVFSGAVADRLPKRRILIATQATLGCQALLLAALAGSGVAEYWHIGVLAFTAGLANTIDMPARQSFVAEIVGRDDLVTAVALNSASFNAARIVGPAIAGLLIGQWGVVPAFVVNGAGFMVVIATLVTLRTEGRPLSTGGRSVLSEVAEGFRYVAGTARLRLVMGLLFAVSFTVFNFTVYVPLFARNLLALGAEGFGFLMASLGVGAVSGALALGSLRGSQPSLAAMFGAATIACAGLAAMAVVRHFWVAVAMLFVIGLSGTLLVAGCNTAMQLTAPDRLRGRVMSLYALIWGGVFPIGAFLVGSISEAWGVSRAFLVMGSVGLSTLAALAVWWGLRGEEPAPVRALPG
jgi:MFS family permease